MDELDRQRLEELVMGYPEEMHLVGGPYCGWYLKPHKEIILNVWSDMKQEGLNPAYAPHNFHPVREDEVVFTGGLGVAVYQLNEDLRWSFVRLLEPEPLA